MRDYLAVFVVAMGFSFFVTPLVERISLHFGLVDEPSDRKIHANPIPRIGGLGIYISFIAAFFLFTVNYIEVDKQLIGIITGGTLIMLAGLVDDIVDLKPGWKLAAQVSAALVLTAFDVRMEFIGNPAGGLLDLGPWAIPFTVLWIVALINMVNLIDGLDGLAAGVCSIAAMVFFYTADATGRTAVAFITIGLAGATLGFLVHNFNPASIFMGDSGSMFLGFMLGAMTIQGVMKGVAVVSLLMPMLIMGIPLFDTVYAVFRRLRYNQPLMRADRGHIHHQLLNRGFSHRQSVLIIYLWCMLLSAAALALNFAPAAWSLPIFIVLLSLSIYFAQRIGLFSWMDRWR